MIYILTETSVILRSILYQLKTGKTLDSVLDAVEAMCMEEDIAAVEKKIADSKARIAAESK
ncbi:hypothetical protein AGMMS49975_04130 [Clostridia bacterium]|nr:hypothetical protein AGMMS49975_04130 [Clostridia bacterium]